MVNEGEVEGLMNSAAKGVNGCVVMTAKRPWVWSMREKLRG